MLVDNGDGTMRLSYKHITDKLLLDWAAQDLLDALTDLLDGVESAIKAGDWKVDGACDPDVVIARAKEAINKATGVDKGCQQP